MEESIRKYQTIIEDFVKLPKIKADPTWLEICRYPYSRFEEVCSRILAFYLDPNAEHDMGALWITALLAAIGKSNWYDYRHTIKVKTEEYADGKRIDITVVSENYVIAIENKITAGLYNPLDIYRDYICRVYPKKDRALVVLSLKPIQDTFAMKSSGFQRCSYRKLFEEVNKHLGGYIASANQKYLTAMIDFMKTIGNMNDYSSQFEKEFFGKNKQCIDELIRRYESYKAQTLKEQIDQISLLKDRMNELTNGKWGAWNGWVLGVSFNESSHRIGIDSYFEEEDGNPTAHFKACITTWRKDDWPPYREAVKKEFANDILKIEEPSAGDNRDRVFVRLYDKKYDNIEYTAGELKKIYDKLAKITSEIK
ncbi:MAG TPA: PD-(D/E)XK nuclease family protein [Candidatus Coprenecus stercoravium]|uniref:PD-(D/E)XK nuclease family protein n=1 Tax=Candidatus Coprenecus stercoravium TaxID=2840735 RepID=A0A9D2K9Q5_9BACT|nr:PD-(D/E)XK nuclease family protein [Candidatus Coprenecus stercoravium]